MFNLTFTSALIVCTLLILNLAACGGTLKDEDNPKLLVSSIISLPENTILDFLIQAQGKAPLTYSIVGGEDAQHFNLHPKTGILSTDHTFDFESPLDRNLDNRYELIISVSNTSGLTTSKNISVILKDSEEYRVVVDFPPQGAIIGGHIDGVSIRGHIEENGARVQAPDKNLKVFVGLEEASFIEGTDSIWVVEHSTSKGEMNLEVRAELNEVVIETGRLVLDNSLPVSLHGVVSTGDGTNLTTDKLDKSIISYSSGLGGVKALATLPISGLPCDTWESLNLSPNGSQLIAECKTDAEDTFSVVSLNLTSLEYKLLWSNKKRPLSTHWIEENTLLIQRSSSNFSLLPISTGVERSFGVFTQENKQKFSGAYFTSGLHLYLFNEDSRAWVVADLQALALSGSESLEAVLTTIPDLRNEYSIPFETKAAVVNGKAYFTSTCKQGRMTVAEVDLDSYTTQALEIQSFQSGSDIVLGVIPNLIFTTRDSFLLNCASDIGVVKINIAEKSATQIAGIDGFGPLEHSLEIDLSENSQTLVAMETSPTQASLFWANISDYSLTKKVPLHFLESIYDGQGQIDVDFENNILYKRRIHYIGFLSEAAFNIDEVILESYNFLTKKYTSILTGRNLQDFLGGTTSRYYLGKTIITDNPNILWLVINQESPFGRTGTQSSGVYRFNIESRELSLIREIGAADNPDAYNPYMSHWSDHLNGVLLTNSHQEHITVLHANGDIEEVLPVNSAFGITKLSKVDNRRGLVYFDRYAKGISSPLSDETVELNLDTGDVRVVVSSTRGRGFSKHISTALRAYQIDENRQNLISVSEGYLVIVDTYSGDGVLLDFH